MGLDCDLQCPGRVRPGEANESSNHSNTGFERDSALSEKMFEPIPRLEYPLPTDNQPAECAPHISFWIRRLERVSVRGQLRPGAGSRHR